MISRVVGKIIDVETGEVLPPIRWAKAARPNPQNQPWRIDQVREADGYTTTRYGPAPAHEIEICFTGFNKADKARLEADATGAGMLVRKTVTKGLTHLCTGPNAGQSKISQAIEYGAELIEEQEFYILLASS